MKVVPILATKFLPNFNPQGGFGGQVGGAIDWNGQFHPFWEVGVGSASDSAGTGLWFAF